MAWRPFRRWIMRVTHHPSGVSLLVSDFVRRNQHQARELAKSYIKAHLKRVRMDIDEKEYVYTLPDQCPLCGALHGPEEPCIKVLSERDLMEFREEIEQLTNQKNSED